MNCFYKIRNIEGQSLVFDRTNETMDFISENYITSVWQVVFFEFELGDIPLLYEIAKVEKIKQYCFLCNSMSQIVIDKIYKFMSEHQLDDTHFMFSCQVATRCILHDNAWIGNIRLYNDDLMTCAINSGPESRLEYCEFKSIIGKAKKIANTVDDLQLKNNLEKIVWLDNWFQRNIQYIKERESKAGGDVYICDSITRISTMSDVLLNHYGTCEDIAASIVAILAILDIPCNVVGDTGHAWLLIHIDNASYIWDCTHNITRNPNRMENALKAKEYTDTYTLIGYSTFNDKYPSYQELFSDVSKDSYLREEINTAKKRLAEYGVSFVYSDEVVVTSIKHKT